jgi:hypothetical protein
MRNRFYKNHFSFLLFIAAILLNSAAAAQTTAFTYQGKLTNSGNLANGNYDLQFKLFDAVTVGTGTQQGSTVTVSNVSVTSGIFTMALDFGVCSSCFNGAARFLEIAVKPTSSSTFTTLAPRQPITSTPYAFKSQNAATATTADGLSEACAGCVTDSHINSIDGAKITGLVAGSQISGEIPIASVPDGSGNYIQNASAAQKAESRRFNRKVGSILMVTAWWAALSPAMWWRRQRNTTSAAPAFSVMPAPAICLSAYRQEPLIRPARTMPSSVPLPDRQTSRAAPIRFLGWWRVSITPAMTTHFSAGRQDLPTPRV